MIAEVLVIVVSRGSVSNLLPNTTKFVFDKIKFNLFHSGCVVLFYSPKWYTYFKNVLCCTF